MKTLLIISLAVMTIWLTSCNSRHNSNKPKNTEELKIELKQQEQKSPQTYIDDQNVTLQPQQKKIRNAGLIREAKYEADGAVIQGNIINKATLAKFKDIEVKVSFYSQTETLIDNKSYILYQFIEPNSTISFSMKIDQLPKAYKTFGFEVMNATPVYQ